MTYLGLALKHAVQLLHGFHAQAAMENSLQDGLESSQNKLVARPRFFFFVLPEVDLPKLTLLSSYNPRRGHVVLCRKRRSTLFLSKKQQNAHISFTYMYIRVDLHLMEIVAQFRCAGKALCISRQTALTALQRLLFFNVHFLKLE